MFLCWCRAYLLNTLHFNKYTNNLNMSYDYEDYVTYLRRRRLSVGSVVYAASTCLPASASAAVANDDDAAGISTETSISTLLRAQCHPLA